MALYYVHLTIWDTIHVNLFEVLSKRMLKKMLITNIRTANNGQLINPVASTIIIIIIINESLIDLQVSKGHMLITN